MDKPCSWNNCGCNCHYPKFHVKCSYDKCYFNTHKEIRNKLNNMIEYDFT